MQKLATPYDEGVASFEPICGMHVGLQGFNCLVLCGFINSIPHKVAVTVSEILTQTDSSARI